MFRSYENSLYTKRDKQWKILTPQINQLISSSLTEETWGKITKLLQEEVSFTYTVEESVPKTVYVTSPLHGETHPETKYENEEVEKTATKVIFGYQDLLTHLHQLNANTNGKDEDRLYPYMQQCIEKLLSSSNQSQIDIDQSKIDIHSDYACTNIQHYIAIALKRHDYELVEKILTHSRFASLPLLSAMTIENKPENLLHYYMDQVRNLNLVIKTSYGRMVKEKHHQATGTELERAPNFPYEMLNLIHSYNPKAGDCGMLLLANYTKYHLNELNETMTGLKNYSSLKQRNQATLTHFWTAARAYCQWRNVMYMSAFANDEKALKLDKEIRNQLTQCFQVMSKNRKALADILHVEDFQTDLIKNITTFCIESKFSPQVTNTILKDIATEFVVLETMEKTKAAAITEKQRKYEAFQLASKNGYLDNVTRFSIATQNCLDNLCQNFLRKTTSIKKGKEISLEKISHIIIEDPISDNKNEEHKFANSKALAEHLMMINASDIPLSMKLHRITNILLQVHNKILALPWYENKLFKKKPSETADKTYQVLEEFAKEMSSIHAQIHDKYNNTDTYALRGAVGLVHAYHPQDKHGKTDRKKIEILKIEDVLHILRKHEGPAIAPPDKTATPPQRKKS